MNSDPSAPASEYLFACASCGQEFVAAPALCGHRARCPGCNTPITVPAAEESLTQAPSASALRLPAFFQNPSGICLFCGSRNLRTVSARGILSVSGDRLCKECGAIWSPRVPEWAAIVFLAVLGAMGGTCALSLLFGRGADAFHILILAGGIITCSIGIYVAFMVLIGKAGKLTVHKVGSYGGAGGKKLRVES